MEITVTQKDIENAGIQNSHSGLLIDELAYAAGQWTEDDLIDNNCEYEPYTPYSFDYEKDLLENTKTLKALTDIFEKIGYNFETSTIKISGSKCLQAGAQVALYYKNEWDEILLAYTEKLKEDRTEGISENYNKELQEEIDSFWDDMDKEWLYGDRSFNGVVYEISKYYTESMDGEYNKKENTYTFLLNDYDIEKAKDEGYNKRQLKKWLLNNIYDAGYSRSYKDKIEREKRAAERERLAQYKKEQAEKAEQERKEKLLALTL